MKKSLVALSVLAVLSATSVAQAAIPNTYYAGISAGVARQASQSLPEKVVFEDNTAFAGGIYGGYSFNQYFGVEAAYEYIGNFKYQDTNGDYKLITHGPELFARLSLPLSDNGSDLFVRGGGMYAFSAMDNTPGSDKFVPVAGFGVQVQFTDSLGVRAGYDRYFDMYEDHANKRDHNVSYDVDKVYFALNYTFNNAPAPVVEPVTKTITQTYNLDANTTFGFDSAELTAEGKEAVNAVLVEVEKKDLQFVKYDVAGYTDPIGKAEYNQKLSERRANAVANELVSKGVASGSISATGFGAADSVVGTACDGAMSKNERIKCYAPDRRVVINVTGTTSETVTE